MPAVLNAWRDLLAESGHHPGAVLGSGMEGTVLDLGEGRVAKIWHRRAPEELERLQAFYAAVAEAGLPVATPRVLAVLRLDGQIASVEHRLDGRPLWTPTGEGSPTLTDADVACMVEVLAALAAVAPTPAMASLPVLEGEPPFDGQDFPHALARLVERRTTRFRGPLLARLPGLDRLTEAVVRALEGLPRPRPGLVHGDLIPGNVLVDERRRPSAVLDFGFLTTVGDPAFDAAVTASIYDMYGPRAAEVERRLDEALAARFGHERARLGAYRAAYALATANCFSASGGDGHFEWCTRMLERHDVLAAVDL